jgi:hypothetical protein
VFQVCEVNITKLRDPTVINGKINGKALNTQLIYILGHMVKQKFVLVSAIDKPLVEIFLCRTDLNEVISSVNQECRTQSSDRSFNHETWLIGLIAYQGRNAVIRIIRLYKASFVETNKNCVPIPCFISQLMASSRVGLRAKPEALVM